MWVVLLIPVSFTTRAFHRVYAQRSERDRLDEHCSPLLPPWDKPNGSILQARSTSSWPTPKGCCWSASQPATPRPRPPRSRRGTRPPSWARSHHRACGAPWRRRRRGRKPPCPSGTPARSVCSPLTRAWTSISWRVERAAPFMKVVWANCLVLFAHLLVLRARMGARRACRRADGQTGRRDRSDRH